jgi:hypothetical protein
VLDRTAAAEPLPQSQALAVAEFQAGSSSTLAYANKQRGCKGGNKGTQLLPVVPTSIVLLMLTPAE